MLRDRIGWEQSTVRGHCQREMGQPRERVPRILQAQVHLGSEGLQPCLCPAQRPLTGDTATLMRTQSERSLCC